ncbi:hypothetical protein ACPPVO_49650 [Dactylosporangium sp. McL0621]|uniref:hypothetical protein n=1 Tax=Dactylosporangium sp. McL0621 TaxID=3415678 RepID=UPI003CFB8B6A
MYVAAADQLASDRAAVRLAGLYTLERLGQDNVKLRQTDLRDVEFHRNADLSNAQFDQRLEMTGAVGTSDVVLPRDWELSGEPGPADGLRVVTPASGWSAGQEAHRAGSTEGA